MVAHGLVPVIEGAIGPAREAVWNAPVFGMRAPELAMDIGCLLYTSDAADERSSVDLGGCRIIKKKKTAHPTPPPPLSPNSTLLITTKTHYHSRAPQHLRK